MYCCIVTRCLSSKTNGNQFHFRGYYLGFEIEKIFSFDSDYKISINLDYLIWAKVISIKNKILYVKIIKLKSMDHINLF